MLNILIAPNAFKNSLTATAAAEAIRLGLLSSKLHCSCECFPVGDGGDGTIELLIKKLNGTSFSVTVNGPLGHPVSASVGLIDGGDTALIEMADACGLRLLKQEELNPLAASSYGTGQMIKAALDEGVRKIIIGMGGSATVDGGFGILRALGIRFLGADGNELTNLPEVLTGLVTVDTFGLDQRIATCQLTILCDVDNTLLGATGAAEIFGPQKGASSADVKKLEAALTMFTKVTLQHSGINIAAIAHGGTAGGAAAGLHAYLNATLVNGIAHFLNLTHFDTALQKASLVITGEGSIDEQTLRGKAPFGVAARAKLYRKPVVALAGKIPLVKSNALQNYFEVLLAIGNGPGDLQTAMGVTAQNLQRTATEAGNLLALIK